MNDFKWKSGNLVDLSCTVINVQLSPE